MVESSLRRTRWGKLIGNNNRRSIWRETQAAVNAHKAPGSLITMHRVVNSGRKVQRRAMRATLRYALR